MKEPTLFVYLIDLLYIAMNTTWAKMKEVHILPRLKENPQCNRQM